MSINSINAVLSARNRSTLQPQNNTNVNFRASNDYENPINRSTERNLAVLGSTGISLITGALGWFCTGLIPKFNTNKTAKMVGAAIVGLTTLGLTLPAKLYNTKVRAFTREKEMDVFSRQKDAQTNIYEDINSEIKDENVSLDDKINHYSTVKMADNGNGVMLKEI